MEDTKGSQPQEPPKAKKPRKKAPVPPSPTRTYPAPSDSEDDLSAEEDATGRQKKASITQMLDEHQEDRADWWREHPGLYDKSNETYRRKTKKDKLIPEKAQVIVVLIVMLAPLVMKSHDIWYNHITRSLILRFAFDRLAIFYSGAIICL